MHRGSRGSALLLALAMLSVASIALADPCLTVYPLEASSFVFDPSTHFLAGPAHPAFDHSLAVAGAVLVDADREEIEYRVHRAPGLSALTPTTDGAVGFTLTGSPLRLAVDGFSNRPRVLRNVTLVIETVSSCPASVRVNGSPVEDGRVLLGDLEVRTPAKGNNYSDVMVVDLELRVCGRVTIWAFADEDGDGRRDGGECFSAFGRDFSVPTEAPSWSSIKTRW